MQKKTASQITLQLLDGRGQVINHWDLQGKNGYRLGRGPDNDVTLHHSWVSRKHAIIQVEGKGLHNLIDLGSSNGTFVNGRRIYTPTTLHSGDEVGIGSTRLIFRQPEEPPSAVPPAADDLEEKTVAFIRREQVTLLICDIHDFTRISEKLDSGAVSELLRVWTAGVNTVIKENGGLVDKFIGDAVLAVWGGGEVHQTIRRALIAASQINQLTGELGYDLPTPTGRLTIGAVVNTGEAAMGNMGVDSHRDYTVIGDVVNVAFRLEGLTSREQGLDVVLGEEAAGQLGAREPFFKEFRCQVRGKSEPVRACGCSFEQLQAFLAG